MSETQVEQLRRLATQNGADAATCRAAADRIEFLEAEVARLQGARADEHSHQCIRCGHSYTPAGEDEDCPKCGCDGTLGTAT